MRRTDRPLHAASLAVLLLCAASPAMARNATTVANGESACPGNEETSTDRARQAAESRAKPAATTAAKPTTRSTGTATSGSGDDGAGLRQHGAKWHSFLPGMFR